MYMCYLSILNVHLLSSNESKDFIRINKNVTYAPSFSGETASFIPILSVLSLPQPPKMQVTNICVSPLPHTMQVIQRQQ